MRVAVKVLVVAVVVASQSIYGSRTALQGYDAAAAALDKTQQALTAVDAALAVLEAVAGAAQ